MSPMSSTYVSSAAAEASMSGFLLIMFGVTAAAYVIGAWSLSTVFKKAGVESWKAWVPVYNQWTMLELGGQPGWWALLSFVPFVNIASVVFLMMAVHNINLAFGKDVGFTVLYFFLPLVWALVLGLGDSRWNSRRVRLR